MRSPGWYVMMSGATEGPFRTKSGAVRFAGSEVGGRHRIGRVGRGGRLVELSQPLKDFQRMENGKLRWGKERPRFRKLTRVRGSR